MMCSVLLAAATVFLEFRPCRLVNKIHPVFSQTTLGHACIQQVRLVLLVME